jgi:hypothetical protein
VRELKLVHMAKLAPKFLAEHKELLGEAISMIKEARPFVLQDTSYLDHKGKLPLLDPSAIAGLPFETCCFESADAYPLVNVGSEVGDTVWSLLAIIAKEVSPGNYRLLPLIRHQDGTVTMAPVDASRFRNLTGIISVIISSLPGRRLVSERVSLREKITAHGGPHFIKISQVVRVCGPNVSATVAPLFGGTIDYSYRFEVMGHWRRIGGVGKDRHGKYTISGYTWVVPHERGPEGAPLVKKARLVIKNPESPYIVT